jgi:hypothetical protein
VVVVQVLGTDTMDYLVVLEVEHLHQGLEELEQLIKVILVEMLQQYLEAFIHLVVVVVLVP